MEEEIRAITIPSIHEIMAMRTKRTTIERPPIEPVEQPVVAQSRVQEKQPVTMNPTSPLPCGKCSRAKRDQSAK